MKPIKHNMKPKQGNTKTPIRTSETTNGII